MAKNNMIFVVMNDTNGITQTGYLYQDTKELKESCII